MIEFAVGLAFGFGIGLVIGHIRLRANCQRCMELVARIRRAS